MGDPTEPRASRTLIEDRFADDLSESERLVGAGLRPARAIGGSLNALVRATGLYRRGVEKFAIHEEGGASETQRNVGERAAKAWRRAAVKALDLEATKVTVQGDLALQTDAETSQWVLYAFMAGVRRIVPRRVMTTPDVITLVQALVELEPRVESIERFRDWLDAGGAEGFDIRIHTSFTEVFEENDLEEEREFSKAFAMARFEAPRSADSVYVAARDLDMVAMRKEFEVPIEMYASGTMNAEGGMSDEDLAELGRRVDDGNAWATAELEAVLAIPALRTAVTPEQMAKRVVSRLSMEADERFLMLLTKLNNRDDPFQQEVARALGTPDVGEVIARQLYLSSEKALEALGEFLVLSPKPLALAVGGGLLDRATDEEEALDAICKLAQWYGGGQFSEWVHPPSLAGESAEALGVVFARAGAAPADISGVILAAPMESALAVLNKLSAGVLKGLGRPLRTLWGRAKHPEIIEELAGFMIKGAAKDNLTHLGKLLLDGKLDKWKGKMLYALCGALVDAQLGRKYVLPIAEKRGAKEQTRLIAIDCLQRDAELVEAIAKFRFSRMFESSAVKDRIKKLSREGKA